MVDSLINSLFKMKIHFKKAITVNKHPDLISHHFCLEFPENTTILLSGPLQEK